MTDPALSGHPTAVLAAFEQLSSAVFVHEGPEHVFAAVNDAGRKILGNRQLLGRTVREALPETDGQRLAEQLDRAYRTGEQVDGREWRLLMHDENGRLAELFLSFTVKPIRLCDGTVVGTVSNAVDVTEEVNAREAARARAGQVEQRYRAARDVVVALQGSLLPETLPVLPGVQLAARYLVAGDDQAAGGDWFDAVPLPDGSVALVTGDVVGHGARASAVMGQLRAVLTACLLEGHGVSAALARLDRYVARVPSAVATTVCLAVLDPASGGLSYACCGHPPPLLLGADGRARYLPVEQGVPLGTAGATPPAAEVFLGPGEMVLLYTDGLVERQDRSLPEGMEQLAVYAGDALLRGPEHMMAAAAVDRVCRLSMERMTRDGYHDDVSLIAAQLIAPAPEAFHAELPARPEVLPRLRHDLGGWLAAVGASESDVQAIQVAVGEAVTNAVEHAYAGAGAGSRTTGQDDTAGGAGGRVTVEGYHDVDGRACLTVTDHGSWRPPPTEPGARGRGLIMIRGCMDTTEIDSSPDGTSVLMDRQLTRAPVLVGGDESEPWRQRAGPGATVTELTAAVSSHRSSWPVLALRGPIDVSTVEEFRERLQDVGRGGSLPLEVDLTEVNHLASTGVQVLHELAEQMGADGRALRLIAPPGSPARAVLELTGLGHLVG